MSTTKSSFQGKLFLLQIKNSGSYSTIGGMRATEFEINHRQIDVTNKCSNGWRELMNNSGLTSVSISGRGVFTNSACEEKVIQMSMKGTIEEIRIVSESKNSWSGKFVCTNYKRIGNYDGEENYYISLESAGEVTFCKLDSQASSVTCPTADTTTCGS